MRGKSYAAGTIVNALATGIGCAFGLNLETKVKISVEDELKRCIVLEDGVERENSIVDRVMLSFNFRGVVEIQSDIPKGSGLGSSSAFMNALIVSALKMRGEELDAHRILAANARISLEMGISYTGAFDDASASLLGGIALSNNMRMKLYRWDRAEGEALVLLPQWKRGKVSLEIIRRDPLEVEKAVKAAFNGDYKSAMLYNSNYYCRLLGYPIEPVERALEMDVYAGLSGNGPAYVAFGKRENIREVERIWQEYGKLIKTKVVSEAAEDVKIPTYLFVDLDK